MTKVFSLCDGSTSLGMILSCFGRIARRVEKEYRDEERRAFGRCARQSITDIQASRWVRVNQRSFMSVVGQGRLQKSSAGR